MLWFILFIIGLVIGSFLNVVALRYSPERSLMGVSVIGGRSHCTTCQVNLRWYELVPVLSFLVQGAKCRHCRHALNWQYPIIELAGAFLTASLPGFLFSIYNVQLSVARNESVLWFYALTALWLLAGYILLVIAAIDMRLSIIPDQANALLGLIAIALTGGLWLRFGMHAVHFSGPYGDFLGAPSSPFLSALLGALAGLILFGGVIWLTKGRGMGLGDLKLAIPLGLLLGWPDAIIAFMASFVIGSLVGITLIYQKTKTLKAAIPFGPFIVIGAFVAIFYSESILQWYFSLV